MSYLAATTKGLNLKSTQLRCLRLLFKKADTAWIVLTDWGYEVSVLGELHTISYSLKDAISELELEILGSFRQGLPKSLEMMCVSDGVWGVDMVDLVRRSRMALESL